MKYRLLFLIVLNVSAVRGMGLQFVIPIPPAQAITWSATLQIPGREKQDVIAIFGVQNNKVYSGKVFIARPSKDLFEKNMEVAHAALIYPFVDNLRKGQATPLQVYQELGRHGYHAPEEEKK